MIILTTMLVLVSGCGSATTPTVGSTSTKTEQSASSKPPTQTDWIAVQLNHDQLSQEQDGEKDGHRRSLLMPELVARDFALDTDGLNEFAKGKLNDKQFVKDAIFELAVNGETLRLHLMQPIQQGKQGIWLVDKYQLVK